MADLFHKIESSFKIESIGYPQDRRFSPDFDFEGESHDFTELVYVRSGSIEIVENDKVYILKDGDMILHAPMEFHRLKSAEHTSPRVINLSFTTQGIFPEKLFEGVFHLNLHQRTTFTECFEAAQKLIMQKSDSVYLSQQTADKLSAFFLEMAQSKPLKNVLSTDSSALLYKKLVNDMQKMVYDNISLAELAKINFVSVSYVKKLFSTYLKTGPKHFYDSLRAKEAAQLLQSGISVTEVAEKMNFSSPNHFTVFFKRHFGITPSEFKK